MWLWRKHTHTHTHTSHTHEGCYLRCCYTNTTLCSVAILKHIPRCTWLRPLQMCRMTQGVLVNKQTMMMMWLQQINNNASCCVTLAKNTCGCQVWSTFRKKHLPLINKDNIWCVRCKAWQQVRMPPAQFVCKTVDTLVKTNWETQSEGIGSVLIPNISALQSS